MIRMHKKIITMTAYKRPDYTKLVIDNLKNCIGFEDYLLLARIEPGYPEVEIIFKDLPNCKLIINDGPRGCGVNTYKILEEGFKRSDFVIHMEDDTIPGIDCLKYFEYLNKRYKDDNSIFTVSAFNRMSNSEISRLNPTDYFSINKCQSFTGWIWGTWNSRWQEIREKWVNEDPPGWDHNINRNIRKGRYEIVPTLPRSLNIGSENSLHAIPYIWKKCQHSQIWVNNAPNIEEILQSNLLPSSILSRLSDNGIQINELPYLVKNATNGTSSCPSECGDDRFAILTVLGIGIGFLAFPH